MDDIRERPPGPSGGQMPSGGEIRGETENERAATQGWGATLRIATLVLARGLAVRLAMQRRGYAGRWAVGGTAAAAALGRARGWW